MVGREGERGEHHVFDVRACTCVVLVRSQHLGQTTNQQNVQVTGNMGSTQESAVRSTKVYRCCRV